jgi:hypothetical protein
MNDLHALGNADKPFGFSPHLTSSAVRSLRRTFGARFAHRLCSAYGKYICVPWIDPARVAEGAVTVSNKYTVTASRLAFAGLGGSDLTPQRDILTPRFVFHDSIA